ncbi:dUTP diphosphatase [Rhizobium johnstonii]|uniref:dUTP diphosphatase n=1 Tax=Rhizobium johnstonii TaxID=3019933 RepID=UPI003F94C166
MSARFHIKVLLLNERAMLPEYQSDGAAGADIFAAFDDSMIELAPGARAVIPCGIAIELPPGAEAQIRSRSGLAAKHGIMVLNSPGTIDGDYRGEINVILFNTSDTSSSIRSGDRIAQMVIAPVLHAKFELSSEISGSRRGAGGFGSTGI